MLSIIGFLAILAPLVVVHEMGHFLFAKLFNVKAEAFSVGFGPKLLGWKWGETEFKVSLIPLGGYVKLLGEEPGVELKEEERHRALQNQARWKRFFIFFGGPLFNFIFAVIVFMAIMAIGEPQMGNVIGRVLPESKASVAGFKAGDRVVEIDGKAIRRFEDLVITINESPEKPIHFKTISIGQSTAHDITVTPSAEPGYSMYGEEKLVGHIDGILPQARSTQVGVSNPRSLAGTLGIKTRDEILALNGVKVHSWEELELQYSKLAPKTTLTIELKDAAGAIKQVNLKLPAKLTALDRDLGIFSSELFIEKVVADSPAMKSGLLEGDRILSVQKQSISSFFKLREKIQAEGEKNAQSTNPEAGRIAVEWEREGKLMSAQIVPTASHDRDPSLRKTVQYTIGVMPLLTQNEPEMIVDRIWNPFVLVFKATDRMLTFTWRNLVSIGKMFTGNVSMGTLGGPILIGKLAGDSLARGLIAFLTTMAVLSVGLGILNVLPVPVLDGGHIMLLGVEAVRGKPLTTRQMEVVQQVGLSLVLLLMVIVIRNDLTRLPFFK